MSKFKTLLVGIALALPFTALNAARPVDAISSFEGPTAPAGIEIGISSTYTCCWVYYMGRWYCVPYC